MDIPYKKEKYRAAFSLIELLIVIVIIGVVYTLSIGKFQKLGSTNVRVDLQNLKQYLKNVPKQSGIDTYKMVRLLCLDDCSSCDVLVDGKKVSEDNHFTDFLDSSVKVYRYDIATGTTEVPQKVYFNSEGIEENVCFSYGINKNGVGDQVIIEYKNKVYDYSVYLEKTQVYSSLQKLINMKEKLFQEVVR